MAERGGLLQWGEIQETQERQEKKINKEAKVNKITVTITGMDKKTVSYIAKKISPIPGGLHMELGERIPYISPAKVMAPMTRKELVILTPFHTDGTPVPALAPCWYKALVPSPFPGNLPKEYRFRSPFSLMQVIADIERKFSLDHRLIDFPIILCVKRKDTGKENTLNGNWKGKIEHIMTEESSERSG